MFVLPDILCFTFQIHGLNIDRLMPTAKTNLDANISFCVFCPALHGLLMGLTLAVCLWRFKGTWNCHEVDFHYDSIFYNPPKRLSLSWLLSFDWILFHSLVSSLTAVNCHSTAVFTQASLSQVLRAAPHKLGSKTTFEPAKDRLSILCWFWQARNKPTATWIFCS